MADLATSLSLLLVGSTLSVCWAEDIAAKGECMLFVVWMVFVVLFYVSECGLPLCLVLPFYSACR